MTKNMAFIQTFTSCTSLSENEQADIESIPYTNLQPGFALLSQGSVQFHEKHDGHVEISGPNLYKSVITEIENWEKPVEVESGPRRTVAAVAGVQASICLCHFAGAPCGKESVGGVRLEDQPSFIGIELSKAPEQGDWPIDIVCQPLQTLRNDLVTCAGEPASDSPLPVTRAASPDFIKTKAASFSSPAVGGALPTATIGFGIIAEASAGESDPAEFLLALSATSAIEAPGATAAVRSSTSTSRHLQRWAESKGYHHNQIRRLLRLLDPDHLRSLPIRKKSRSWPKLPVAKNFRHHFYRQVAHILGWRDQETFDDVLTSIVRSHWSE